MKQRKNAIVTGGAGFIGSHLVERLAAEGFRVTVVDNLSTGKRENIAPLLETGAVTLHEASVTDLPSLHTLFTGADYVFHLAAFTSVPGSIEHPAECHEVNGAGTLNVLLAARDCGARKVVSASSAAVYGDDPVLPKAETMPPQPLSPYAVTKLAGEYYHRVFTHVYSLPAVCLRYFNVYGPRQDPGSSYAAAVPKFIANLQAGQPPVIYGDGEQTRDFIYVKDAVAATCLAATSDAGGIYNIAGGRSITINELARTLISLTGRDITPDYMEARAGDIRHSLADTSRAREYGFTPDYSLENGLRETVAWFEKS